jgi:N-acetylglucosamine-6-phosphate deacetylase
LRALLLTRKNLALNQPLATKPSIEFIEKINKIAEIKTITLAPEIKAWKCLFLF